MCAKSLQLCLTLCNPLDCNPPGSSVYGILQARILEWVAIPPGNLPDPGIKLASLCLLHWQMSSLPLASAGKPITVQDYVADCVSWVPRITVGLTNKLDLQICCWNGSRSCVTLIANNYSVLTLCMLFCFAFYSHKKHDDDDNCHCYSLLVYSGHCWQHFAFNPLSNGRVYHPHFIERGAEP